MKVALYARVSKPQRGQMSEQQKKDQDPEVQLRELRVWCDTHQHSIVAEYVDRLTGKHTQRPQLQKMMRDATEGLRDIDAVVVWRLDRFGRSVPDLYDLVGELREAEIAFVSLKDNFDLSTSMGKLIFGILAVFAEFERNVISERTKAGLALKRAEGIVPGRKIDLRRGPSRTTIWRRSRHQLA